MLALLLLALGAACSQEPTARGVVVFANADPDYKTPPDADTLTGLSAAGTRVWEATGFNTSQRSSGMRLLVASPSGDEVLVASRPSGRVTSVDARSGRVRWTLGARAISLAWTESYIYVGDKDIRRGTTRDPQAGLQPFASIRPVDLDLGQGFLWAIDTHRVFSIPHNGPKTALASFEGRLVSVAAADQDEAWVAERLTTRGKGSPAVHLVSIEGEVRQSVPVPAVPYCVRTSHSGDLWIATGAGIEKRSRSGELLVSRSVGAKCWSLAVDPVDESAWAGCLDGVVRHWSSAGDLLVEVPGFANDQIWLVLADVKEPSDAGCAR